MPTGFHILLALPPQAWSHSWCWTASEFPLESCPWSCLQLFGRSVPADPWCWDSLQPVQEMEGCTVIFKKILLLKGNSRIRNAEFSMNNYRMMLITVSKQPHKSSVCHFRDWHRQVLEIMTHPITKLLSAKNTWADNVLRNQLKQRVAG